MINYTYKNPSYFKNSLCSSLLSDIKTFNDVNQTLSGTLNSIRTVRSSIIGLKDYVSPIIELLNIMGQIPKPRDKTKNKIINDMNKVIDGVIEDVSIPIEVIEKTISTINLSIGNLILIFDKVTNEVYKYGREKFNEYFDYDNDDESVIATIKKYSTEIIGSISTVLSTSIALINQNYAKVINILNTLITNISVKIAKTINSAVENDEAMSDEEVRASVNTILGSTVLQPIIGSIERDVVGKIYNCTGPLRKIGDRIGSILNWNFSMV
jgi:hypothetical protein